MILGSASGRPRPPHAGPFCSDCGPGAPGDPAPVPRRATTAGGSPRPRPTRCQLGPEKSPDHPTICPRTCPAASGNCCTSGGGAYCRRGNAGLPDRWKGFFFFFFVVLVEKHPYRPKGRRTAGGWRFPVPGRFFEKTLAIGRLSSLRSSIWERPAGPLQVARGCVWGNTPILACPHR